MNFADGLTWSHVEHSLVRILTLCLVQPVFYANLVFDWLIWSHWVAIDLKNCPSKGATRQLRNGGDEEAGAMGLKMHEDRRSTPVVISKCLDVWYTSRAMNSCAGSDTLNVWGRD